MIPTVSAVAAAGLVFALGAPPTVDTVRSLVEGAAAGVAVIIAVLGLWRFRRLSSAQREDLEASAAERAVKAMDQVLQRYVQDLRDAKDAIERLEGQLTEANERIVRLEEQLHHATGERDRIRQESSEEREKLQDRLDKALADRVRLGTELEEMRHKVDDLELRVGGRRSTDTSSGQDDLEQ